MITSADGTTVRVHSIGAGPGLVVVHGAMQSGTSQLELARLLADTRTVHLLDRRGRDRSVTGPQTPIEVADLRAVLAQTGAHDVLGISSGAIVAARAALAGDEVRRLALFEPPLPVGGSMRLDVLPRFEAALDSGDLARAMAIAMRVAEMGPPWMFRLPTALLAAAARRMLAADDRAPATEGRVPVRELAHALRADFAIVRENADRLEELAAIGVPTLLLVGTATRPYLRTAVDRLTEVVPGARRVELVGLHHAATQNRAERGRPDLVAPVLREFFAV
ncbi:alpha/beta fold hydrolase [Cellulomonas phragmiteti]|uniref:Alpha/beta hydrolase n=1 Tax=Cellulomonas phragmiteti TaxID=478780 RepID=A0ABQ4DQX2_9CELL|nr:alpha/beta hydrolase [Cellulomonas phragmiteti]GIG41755.1 alpha/beta hydrolase [Cellulomonas phragmiteti]